MPWKSYAAKEQAALIIKEAQAEGRLNVGNGRSQTRRTGCPQAQLSFFSGQASWVGVYEVFGLEYKEQHDYAIAYDQGADPIGLLDRIPVGS